MKITEKNVQSFLLSLIPGLLLALFLLGLLSLKIVSEPVALLILAGIVMLCYLFEFEPFDLSRGMLALILVGPYPVALAILFALCFFAYLRSYLVPPKPEPEL